MNKLINLLFVALFLISCNDSETSISVSYSGKTMSDAIVGRWYSEDYSLDSYQEDTYTNSGMKYSAIYRQMYGYQPYQTHGEYSISGDQMTDKMTLDGTSASILSVCKVDSMNVYSFVTSSPEFGTSHFNRIIGTADMQLGEECNLNVTQYLAQYSKVIPDVYSYSVTDESILDVDESGNIISKLLGDTYIKVYTSQGIAVVKACVTDSTKLWNDYAKGLGKKLSDIESVFGRHYAYKNDSTILYCPQNYYVDSVKFFKNTLDVIDSVSVSFSKDADESLIVRNINSTMILVDSLNLNNLWYTDNSNYLMSTTSAKYERFSKRLMLNFIEPVWDDKIEDFGLTYDKLKEKYGFAMTYTGSSAFYGNIIKNEFISQIQYMFDNKSGEVNSYVIFFGNKITKSMLDNYVDKNYKELYSTIPYARNIIHEGKECYVRVSPNYYERRIYYYFEEFK